MFNDPKWKYALKFLFHFQTQFFPLRPARYSSRASFIRVHISQFIYQKTESLGLKGGYLVKSTFSVLRKTEMFLHFCDPGMILRNFYFLVNIKLFSKNSSLFYGSERFLSITQQDDFSWEIATLKPCRYTYRATFLLMTFFMRNFFVKTDFSNELQLTSDRSVWEK